MSRQSCSNIQLHNRDGLIEYIEGSRPEWCISSMMCTRDTPFWSGTLDMYPYNAKSYHCTHSNPNHTNYLWIISHRKKTPLILHEWASNHSYTGFLTRTHTHRSVCTHAHLLSDKERDMHTYKHTHTHTHIYWSISIHLHNEVLVVIVVSTETWGACSSWLSSLSFQGIRRIGGLAYM